MNFKKYCEKEVLNRSRILSDIHEAIGDILKVDGWDKTDTGWKLSLGGYTYKDFEVFLASRLLLKCNKQEELNFSLEYGKHEEYVKKIRDSIAECLKVKKFDGPTEVKYCSCTTTRSYYDGFCSKCGLLGKKEIR